MGIYQYKEFKPALGKDCFIAPNATVIGRTHMADDVSIWFGAVVRGDVASITIGEGTNVQDLSMLHVTDNIPLIIGSGVTIGHNVVLHSCTIGDNSLIGMGAVILDNAIIGKNSLVAAGSVVTPGKEFPDGVLLRGAPAKVVRDLTDVEKQGYSNHYKTYLKTKSEYLDINKFREIAQLT